MRVVVVGAGAIGGAIGGRLHQAGHHVTLVARGAHHRALAERGLVLEWPGATATLDVEAVDRPDRIEWTDDAVVLLAVKSQDTESALDQLDSAPPTIAVVCAQNGVENERRALRRFADVYGMRVRCPATHLEPGKVQLHAAPVSGLLDVGRYPAGVDDRAAAVVGALAAATFDARAVPDVMAWKHAKLLVSVGTTVRALCGATAASAALAERAADEGRAVLRAAGIEVASSAEDDERWRRVTVAATESGAHRGGSSWQSLARSAGAIEAPFFNGEVVLLGRLHGVATPCNEHVMALATEAARTGRRPGSLDAADVLAQLDRRPPGG